MHHEKVCGQTNMKVTTHPRVDRTSIQQTRGSVEKVYEKDCKSNVACRKRQSKVEEAGPKLFL
jgi:hypothetical protein